MLYNEGLVTKLDGNQAEVKIVREGACGHDCAHCKGCGEGVSKIIARNDVGAKVGDFVSLQGDDVIVRRAFLVYLLPLIFFFVGYAIGFYLFHLSEFSSAFVGLVLFVADFLWTVRYSRKQKELGNIPVITGVIQDQAGA